MAKAKPCQHSWRREHCYRWPWYDYYFLYCCTKCGAQRDIREDDDGRA